mgnify:CR=1 FL=1
MSEPYNRKRTFYQDVSGSRNILAADTTLTLQASKTSDTIFLQKLHIEITTLSAAKTWTFQDSAASPILLVPVIATDAIAHFDFDFGPNGIPLTVAKDLVLSISAAGAGGWVTWEAYLKRTAIAAA